MHIDIGDNSSHKSNQQSYIIEKSDAFLQIYKYISIQK